jgi:hypothetical protein
MSISDKEKEYFIYLIVAILSIISFFGIMISGGCIF